MRQLKGSQIEFLQKYYQLLESMSEGFDYLVQIPDLSSSSIAKSLFNDIVLAFEQINESHRQLIPLLKLDNTDQFQELIQKMTQWFQSRINKEELLKTEIVPSFESWKKGMVTIIGPYVLH
jgi:hypothetical protein